MDGTPNDEPFPSSCVMGFTLGAGGTGCRFVSRATSSERKAAMDITRRLLLPDSCHWSCCCPLLWICRVVVVIAVLILAVVFALRGYPPEAITGPMLVLVAGAVTAAGRLVGAQHGPSATTKPAS